MYRQPDGHHRASGRIVGGRDPSLMFGHDALGDRQTEAEAARPAAEERREQTRQVVGSESGAGVANRNGHLRRIGRAGRHFDPHAGMQRRVLQRVLNQIDEDALEAAQIHHHADVLGAAADDADARGCSLRECRLEWHRRSPPKYFVSER